MDYFARLDVSVKDTSVCIVDDTGRITREVSANLLSVNFHLI
jgi:transposase